MTVTGDRDAEHPGQPAGATDRASELRYRTLIEQSPLSTQIFAPDGSALTANAAWERLWGVGRNELSGYNILHDRQLIEKGIMPHIRRAFGGEAVEIPPIRYDPEETGKPGRPRWVRAHCYPLKDEAGTILEVVLVLEDVTAQQESEHALRESEERYRLLVEHSPQAIAVHQQGVLVYVNPAGAQLVGAASPEELLGRSILEFVHPDYRSLVVQRMRHVQAGGQLAAPAPERFLRLDGTPIDVEVLAIPTTYEGEPASQVIVRDITDQLRDAERMARLQAVTAALSGAVTPAEVARVFIDKAFPTVGAEGGIVAMLDSVAREFELIGAASYPEEVLAPWRRFSVDAPVPVADAVRERQPVLLESADEASSRYRTIPALATSRARGAIAALPLVVEDRVIGAMSLRFVGPRTFTDGDKTFMDALAHQCAQALDRALVYEVERQTRRAAEEATRLRDEFLSVAAHELKTPMTSLRGYAQVALRRLEREGTLDRERVERTLSAIDAQTAKLSRLVNQLLDISRLEAGRLTLELETVDVPQLVRSVVDAVQSGT
ncbi:MAG TPA: PAS domain S-box protein, partial [Chloroflexota bacterium]|nr:PAS domain S-box protein [Chloroflexota bacterium]